MKTLTGKQVRYLRGLGHHLNPAVMIGRDGLSEGLISSTDRALETHELIKIKLQEGCELDRHSAAEELAHRCGAEVVQVLGRTMLFFRRAAEPKIDLP